MQVVFGFLVNLELGAVLSLLLVPLVTLPLLIVHYHRYGRVGRRRAAFYLLVIVACVAVVDRPSGPRWPRLAGPPRRHSGHHAGPGGGSRVVLAR
jgi:hypothetical protein